MLLLVAAAVACGSFVCVENLGRFIVFILCFLEICFSGFVICRKLFVVCLCTRRVVICV